MIELIVATAGPSRYLDAIKTSWACRAISVPRPP